MAKKKYLGEVSDVDIRLLRIFRTVVDCGGMAAAELELHIGLSTISRHISDLETRLGGHKLCHRGRGGFSLTEEGRKIYQSTLRLIASMDAFRTDLDDLHNRITGNLMLAIFDKTVTNPASSMHTALGMFTQKAPDVDITMYVEPTNVIEAGILDGRFQIGVVPFHRPSTALDHFHLFDEQMYLYCGTDHPLYGHPEFDGNDKKIAKQLFAALGFQSPNMETMQSLGLRRRATCYDQDAVTLLVLSGRYVGFLPDHYARIFVEKGQIRRIKNPRFHYMVRYMGITRRAPAPSRRVRIFVDCLKNVHATP